MSAKPAVVASLSLLLSFIGCCAGFAQDSQDLGDGDSSGIRDTARLQDRDIPQRVGTDPGGVFAASETLPPVKFLLIPSFVHSDGVNIGGLTAGYINRSSDEHPFQVRLSYKRINLRNADDRDRFGVDGKVQLLNRNLTTLTLVGDYGRVRRSSRRYKLGLAAEQGLGDQLTLGLNLDYLRNKRDGGASESDVATSAGLSYALNDRTEVSLDYALKNDVDGEDDYSLTLARQLTQPSKRGPATLVLGVAKHGTIFASLVTRFR